MLAIVILKVSYAASDLIYKNTVWNEDSLPISSVESAFV